MVRTENEGKGKCRERRGALREGVRLDFKEGSRVELAGLAEGSSGKGRGSGQHACGEKNVPTPNS